MHNGITRDFLKRYLIVRDYFWWEANRKLSAWGVNFIHDSVSSVKDPISGEMFTPPKPSYWRDRVLDLCEYEITHQNFGLGFNDLMHLDPATFEDIEERVHQIAARTNENLQQMTEGKGRGTENFLKDIRK